MSKLEITEHGLANMTDIGLLAAVHQMHHDLTGSHSKEDVEGMCAVYVACALIENDWGAAECVDEDLAEFINTHILTIKAVIGRALEMGCAGCAGGAC